MRSGIALFTGVVLLAGAGTARADRHANARTVFSTSCTRCHSLNELRAKATVKEKGNSSSRNSGPSDRLRAWLEQPTAIDPNSLCHAARLDANQRESMIGLLRSASDPMVRSTQAAQVPPFSHNGFAEPPKHLGPVLGQGDHR